VLRDESDPGVACVARSPERGRTSVPEDLARVGGEPPRGDRDERRLAGSILAEQRVDLAGKDREICF
jgi:hypothetical protein